MKQKPVKPKQSREKTFYLDAWLQCHHSLSSASFLSLLVCAGLFTHLLQERPHRRSPGDWQVPDQWCSGGEEWTSPLHPLVTPIDVEIDQGQARDSGSTTAVSPTASRHALALVCSRRCLSSNRRTRRDDFIGASLRMVNISIYPQICHNHTTTWKSLGIGMGIDDKKKKDFPYSSITVIIAAMSPRNPMQLLTNWNLLKYKMQV